MKKLSLIPVIILILGLAMSASLMAATVYVNYSTGNDASGDGSSGSPYKSFHKGYTMASNGDILDLTGTFSWDNAEETGGQNSVTGYTINKNITIQGQAADETTVGAYSSFEYWGNRRVFTISSGITATIKLVEISYGKQYILGYLGYSQDGDPGGAIFNEGDLKLENCYLYYNMAGFGSDGIEWDGSDAGEGGDGGTIYNKGQLVVTGTTFYNNNAGYGGSYGEPEWPEFKPDGNGGCIYNEPSSSATAVVTNSTFITNDAEKGGAIYVGTTCTLTLTNCTLKSNTANGSEYGGGIYSEGIVIIKNTILADQGSWSKDFANNSGSVTDNGYNIVEYASGYTFSGTGDITGNQTNLNLSSTLAENNSTTGVKTLKTTSGSVAINAGNSTDNGSVPVPSTDQRGAQRNGTIDIGSYEYWNDEGSLPVELSSFTAEQKSGSVTLRWVTESEIEDLGFILDRSEGNDESWQEMASYRTHDALKGQGTTSIRTEYAFTDVTVEVGESYYYRLSDVSIQGEITTYPPIFIQLVAQPTEFILHQNTPNPFNASTQIRYALHEVVHVRLEIFNTLGQKVTSLVDGMQTAGMHTVRWDGKDKDGQVLASGVYFYRLNTENFVSTRKMVFLR